MPKLRHFLTLRDFSTSELEALIARAVELKTMQRQNVVYQPLVGKVLAMIFAKSSTRTRVSFEAGMAQLGGSAIFLSPQDTQIGRGEPIADTAKVVSSMVDAVMIRTASHQNVQEFAQHSRVPVINALTDLCHPCQLLADVMTFVELRGSIKGAQVAWIGDGFNMCHSYINAASCFGFKLNISCPANYQPDSAVVKNNPAEIQFFEDPKEAVRGCDLVVTDVWASMGQECEQIERECAFAAYQVTQDLLSCAKSDVLFMHCLPAHRGEEVSAEVIDGRHSCVFTEAENRLHAQKALLEFLLTQ